MLENLEKVQHEPQGWLQIRIDEAISMLDYGARKTVVLSSGSALHADQVILALGNFPPADYLSHPSFQLPQPEIKHPRKMLLWIRQLIRGQ